MANLQRLYDAILNGDQKASIAVTREANVYDFMAGGQ